MLSKLGLGKDADTQEALSRVFATADLDGNGKVGMTRTPRTRTPSPSSSYGHTAQVDSHLLTNLRTYSLTHLLTYLLACRSTLPSSRASSPRQTPPLRRVSPCSSLRAPRPRRVVPSSEPAPRPRPRTGRRIGRLVVVDLARCILMGSLHRCRPAALPSTLQPQPRCSALVLVRQTRRACVDDRISASEPSVRSGGSRPLSRCVLCVACPPPAPRRCLVFRQAPGWSRSSAAVCA
jgi:hypothetical protein